MGDYVIQIARSAEKEIAKLPTAVLARASRKIDSLASNPRPSGCVKLSGTRDRWRIRIGDYRVVYAVNDKTRTIDVIVVGHRRFVYD